VRKIFYSLENLFFAWVLLFCPLLTSCSSENSLFQDDEDEAPPLSEAEQARLDKLLIGKWKDSNRAMIFHKGVPVRIHNEGTRRYFADHTASVVGLITISSVATGSMTFRYDIASKWGIWGGHYHETVSSFDCKTIRADDADAARTFHQFSRASIGQTSTFLPITVTEQYLAMRNLENDVLMSLDRIQ